ncbi:methionyl-tRNA formyltransferase [bacterium]|nr:methionyl-tRNA formyltransferase [bacterium]
MKIVFFGTPEFALPALERLLHSKHEVAFVVTQPDRPKGRGQKVIPSPVKELAQRHGVEVIEPVKLKAEGVAEKIRAAGADIAVVAAYGRILPAEILSAPRLGCINIHPSLLPEYRGPAPIQRAILDGRDETGVSLMMLVEEMDAGPIVAQQTVEILGDDDARSLTDMTGVIGADMLLRVLDEADSTKAIEAEPQNDEEATYAPPLEKHEGLIMWADPTERIMYRLRAMTPWPGAYTYINGERMLIITQAEPLWDTEAEELGEQNKALPGAVTSLKPGFGFTVKTGDGHLLVTAVKPEGRKPMDAHAFVIGRGINVGDKLGEKKN